MFDLHLNKACYLFLLLFLVIHFSLTSILKQLLRPVFGLKPLITDKSCLVLTRAPSDGFSKNPNCVRKKNKTDFFEKNLNIVS